MRTIRFAIALTACFPAACLAGELSAKAPNDTAVAHETGVSAKTNSHQSGFVGYFSSDDLTNIISVSSSRQNNYGSQTSEPRIYAPATGLIKVP